VRFELINDCDKVSGIFIIQDELPDELSLDALPPRLTGLSIIHFPEYRRLFGDRVLSDQERIQVSSVTLLFTDIAQSTAMYETLGNAQAYNAVRQHFKILFRSVEAHGGFVIKTIGDAVMASFVNNDDAVKCALEALREFHGLSAGGDSPHKISVKFGIHRGPVLIVNLNGRVDYFGTTVNTAARIQSCAGGNEITFSPETLEGSPAANTILEACGNAVRKEHVSLKGITTDRTIFRLTMLDGPPPQERLGF
jgi:class 3 adenylate cyclase